jgi:hypothetical protein
VWLSKQQLIYRDHVHTNIRCVLKVNNMAAWTLHTGQTRSPQIGSQVSCETCKSRGLSNKVLMFHLTCALLSAKNRTSRLKSSPTSSILSKQWLFHPMDAHIHVQSRQAHSHHQQRTNNEILTAPRHLTKILHASQLRPHRIFPAFAL